MKPLYRLLISLAGSVLLLGSCRKFVEIEPAPNLIETQKIFENKSTALSAVSSVYAQMRFSARSLTNGGLSVFGGLLADELYNTVSSPSADPFLNNNLLSNNAIVTTDFWSSAYSNIYRINAILEALPQSVSLPDTLRRQLMGEMKVTRALYYFYLVNLFGDVPLVTNTDYERNAIAGRTATDSIYRFLVAELTEAKTMLRIAYPSIQRTRPNLYTASCLLSRVYLYLQNWEQAKVESFAVIAAGIYSLNPNLNACFQISSNETIWQVASDNSNSSEGSFFLPSSSSVRPQYAMADQLLNQFETGDLRKLNWLRKNTVAGRDYYYPAKFKDRSAGPVTEYDIVFRLAEQYLIRAESNIQLGDPAGALEDINILRGRAGLPFLATIDNSELRDAVFKERQTELFAEWGHRWLDLKRTGMANAVLSVVKGANWQFTDALMPIPFLQLQVNPNLNQNPGY
ncbi:MAG: RagB/SusD family nutrient uptake outer membrane protein [Sphingobacteriales bacterium]|nr:RagB/SusD family nutrient uptake outer membrane protein [Sphingobacteriales bacterium]